MKILIIKTSSLGDIIHTFPIINFLKDSFFHIKIDWVVEKEGKDLVERHPFINQILEIETRKWRKNLLNHQTLSEYKLFKSKLQKTEYDVVFDLQGNCKSGWITHLARSKNKVGFGLKAISEWPNLFFTNQKFNPPRSNNVREDLLFLVKSYFKMDYALAPSPIFLTLKEGEETELKFITKDIFLSDYKKILICSGSNWENKQLSTLVLEEFLKNFPEKSQFLFLWGNEKEKEKACSLASHILGSVVLPKLTLPLLQHIMAKVDLIISMDSLPLHLAGLTETPTWSIFGPSLARKYAPLNDHHLFFQGTCPYKIKFEKRCPKLRTCKTGSCMKQIDSKDLLRFFLK